MLRKLMKYEFKATKRLMLPAIIVLLLISIFNGVFFGVIEPHISQNNIFVNLFGGVGMTAYVLGIIGIFILSALLGIFRFYKSDLSNEGYLTHTLPITVAKEILSKIIISTFWVIVTGIVVLFSIFVVVMVSGSLNITEIDWASFKEVINAVFTKEGGLVFMGLIYFVIIMILGCSSKILNVYASMAIGFSAKKNKILCSFGAYMVLSLILTVITTIVGMIFSNPLTSMMNSLNNTAAFHLIFIGIILYILILNAVYFFITKYMMENRLNLE